MNDERKKMQNDYQKMIINRRSERVVCGKFGCARSLSLTEQLCGAYCLEHMGENKVDIMKVLKGK